MKKNQKSTLEITEVRIYKVKKSKTLLANCNVCFNNSLIINGIKLVDGKNGMFISFPSKEVDGKYYDVAYIMNKNDIDNLTDAIIEAYENADD